MTNDQELVPRLLPRNTLFWRLLPPVSLMEAEPPRSAFQGWGRNEAENSSFVIRKCQISNFKSLIPILIPVSILLFYGFIGRLSRSRSDQWLKERPHRTACVFIAEGRRPKGSGVFFCGLQVGMFLWKWIPIKLSGRKRLPTPFSGNAKGVERRGADADC